ncbi:MAG: putrescine transport system ATP-binding protein, partial [Cocleimonas sp.]
SQDEKKVIVETNDGDSLILHSATPLNVGATIWLSIRPEKVGVSKTKPEGVNNILQGKVEDIAYSGNISTYYVRLANGETVKAQTTNSRRLSAREITWEDDVWLYWTDTAAIALSE